MALKKAIVIGTGGGFEELQAGDTLEGPVAEVDVVSMTNNNASPITIGMVVYDDAALGVDLAQANAASTAKVFGLVRDASIAAAASGSIQTDGIITSSDWTAVVGAVALVSNSDYFLSAAAAGQLVTTPPTGAPNQLTYVGRSISTTSLEISIERPVARG
jgi:hypothetical protein